MDLERLRKVESLYHAALDLDPADREDFLRKSCANDDDLYREAVSLLNFQDESEAFIESGALEFAARSTDFRKPDELLGMKIGDYLIESFIGAGGMGEVFVANDERLGRRVAIKILSPLLSSDSAHLKRFEREARAASALNHPNILTIFEIGSFENNSYLVTELVDGATLRQRIADGKIKVGEALKIVAQTAEALDAAHRAGIVHRDVKPENIMIRADGYVKLLDFGLAKLIDTDRGKARGSHDVSFATVPGMILGTPSYMSPEQVRGRDADERSDIFSLGVVLYEMISGRQPFAGDTSSDIIASILQVEPEPLAMSGETAPGALQRIVERSLAKDKHDRYQSMSEMLADLNDLRERLKFADSVERFDSGQAFAKPSGRRKRNAIAAAIAIVFMCFAGFWYFRSTEPAKISSIAVLPVVNADAGGETEYLSDGLTESVIDRLSQYSEFRVMSFNSVARYKGRTPDAKEIGNDLNVEAVLFSRLTQNHESASINAELVSTRDNSRIWGYQFNGKAGDVQTMRDTIAREISDRLNLSLREPGADRRDRTYTQNSEAFQLYLKGRFFWNKRSGEGLRRGIEYFNQAIEKDPGFAPAYAGLADCYGLLSNYTDTPPQESMPKAKAAALRALEIDDRLAEAHTSLGLVKKEFEWDFAGAEVEFRRAIEIKPNYATAYQWLAEVLVAQKRYDEAIALMRKAQELDPFSIIINGAVGWSLHHAGKTDEAIAQLQKTRELDPNFARTHFFLGRAYEQNRMFPEAVAATTKAIELSNGNTLFKASLAHIHASSGNAAAAREIMRELDENSGRSYVSPFARALIYSGLADKERAFEQLEIAYRSRDSILFNYVRAPQLHSLVGDPRYSAILGRVGLQP